MYLNHYCTRNILTTGGETANVKIFVIAFNVDAANDLKEYSVCDNTNNYCKIDNVNADASGALGVEAGLRFRL